MGKRRMRSKLPKISDEVLFLEILPRLPVKALSRFKCVSKLWHATISDPKFRFSDQKHRVVFLSYPDTLRSMDDNNSFCELRIPSKYWTTTTPAVHGRQLILGPKEKAMVRLLGSCSGLLLVSRGSSVYLWNPTTKWHKRVLEDWQLDEFPADNKYDRRVLSIMSGLCYDDSVGDYKLVIATDSRCSSHDGYNLLRTRIAVTSTCKIACLRPVHVVPDCLFGTMTHAVGASQASRLQNDDAANCGCVVNGHLHWLVTRDITPVIVRFDPAKEKFEKFPIPQPKQGSTTICRDGLGVMDGLLSIVRWVSRDSESGGNFEIVVMKEYGVTESWTPMFVLPDFVGVYDHCHSLKPLNINGEGRYLFLMMDGNGRKVWAYCPRRKSYCAVINHSHLLAAAVTYTESLVSLPAAPKKRRDQWRAIRNKQLWRRYIRSRAKREVSELKAQLGEREARFSANMQAQREELEASFAARLKAHQEEMEASFAAKLQAQRGEMDASFAAKLQDTMLSVLQQNKHHDHT